MKSEFYLDHAATTKVDTNVMNEIFAAMVNDWMNPSSNNPVSKKIRDEIEKIRGIIANSIYAKPDNIIFTSGGSEANSLIIGSFQNVLSTEIEHSSAYVKGEYNIMPNEDGVVTVESIRKFCNVMREVRNYAFLKNSLFVVQYVNNETGVMNDIYNISNFIHENGGYLHVDAVQAYPYCRVNPVKMGIDSMSVSGHKFGCPKGIGFLYVSDRMKRMMKQIILGSQEYHLRGGTENTPYIYGLRVGVENRNKTVFDSDYMKKNYEMQKKLENRLIELGCKINGINAPRVPHITSCTLPNCVAEYMMYRLAMRGIYVSAGSACNASSNIPSRTLKAMKLTDDEIANTIRISYKELTDEIIDTFCDEVGAVLGEVSL